MTRIDFVSMPNETDTILVANRNGLGGPFLLQRDSRRKVCFDVEQIVRTIERIYNANRERYLNVR